MSTDLDRWYPHDGGWMKGGGHGPAVWSPIPPLTPGGAVRPYLPYEVNPGWTEPDVVEVDRLEVITDMLILGHYEEARRRLAGKTPQESVHVPGAAARGGQVVGDHT